jgi:hypothetical protein
MVVHGGGDEADLTQRLLWTLKLKVVMSTVQMVVNFPEWWMMELEALEPKQEQSVCFLLVVPFLWIDP